MNPQIVYFTVNTSSISSDMRVPSEIMELAQKRFDLVNFDLELDLLDKYSDIKEEPLPERPEWLTRQLMGDQATQASNSNSGSNINGVNGYSSYSSAVQITAAPVTIVDHDELVERMFKMINFQQDRNTCRFLLESSDWNLETAMDLYKLT